MNRKWSPGWTAVTLVFVIACWLYLACHVRAQQPGYHSPKETFWAYYPNDPYPPTGEMNPNRIKKVPAVMETRSPYGCNCYPNCNCQPCECGLKPTGTVTKTQSVVPVPGVAWPPPGWTPPVAGIYTGPGGGPVIVVPWELCRPGARMTIVIGAANPNVNPNANPNVNPNYNPNVGGPVTPWVPPYATPYAAPYAAPMVMEAPSQLPYYPPVRWPPDEKVSKELARSK